MHLRRSTPIPLTILGGSDLEAGDLPPAAAGQHALATYKGAAVRVGGRPLVALLVERLRASGAFDPISIAGPRAVYAGMSAQAVLLETDGSVADNLRAAIEHFLARHPAGQLAITSCDILPEPRDLAAAMADFDGGAPGALWFPLVRAPRDPQAIGAFGWKPRYPLAAEPGAPPEEVFPGHLGIIDPRALRMPLLYSLLDVAYETRNRSVVARRGRMLRAVLGGLLKRDFLQLFAGRAPSLTISVVGAGVTFARKLRARELSRIDVERLIGRIFLRRGHRSARPDLGVRLPILDALSLAEDVDTEEEARFLEQRRDAGRSRADSDAR